MCMVSTKTCNFQMFNLLLKKAYKRFNCCCFSAIMISSFALLTSCCKSNY